VVRKIKQTARLITLAVVFFLAGCQSDPSPMQEIQPTPASTQTATPAATATETSIPDASPTPEDLLHLLPMFESRSDDYSRITVEQSPNGDWLASTYYDLRTTGQGSFEHTKLVIEASSGDREFVVFERVGRRHDMFGVPYPRVLAWSTDLNKAYVIESLGGDGCFGLAYQNLSEVNLSSGEVKQLVPHLSRFLFSPDNQIVAFVPNHHKHLAFLFLDEQKTSIVMEEFIEAESKETSSWQLDKLIWSQDSSVLILAANENSCDINDNTAIVRIDIPTMRASVLRAFENRYLNFLEWREDGIVVVESGYVPTTYWIMNPTTGELNPFEYPNGD
jgi:hypothetical protein